MQKCAYRGVIIPKKCLTLHPNYIRFMTSSSRKNKKGLCNRQENTLKV